MLRRGQEGIRPVASGDDGHLSTAGGQCHRARSPRVTRREQLRRELLTTVDSLARQRAHLVSKGFIADYIALHWLEWNDGALRLTVTGTNICEKMQIHLA